MRTNYPVQMLELAIKGMLPKGRLGRQVSKKLNVYAGAEHPHKHKTRSLRTSRIIN